MFLMPVCAVPVVSGGGAAFTDDFNRADEDLTDSADWSVFANGTGVAGVVSNELNLEATSGTDRVYYVESIQEVDAYAECTVGQTNWSSFLVVRATSRTEWVGCRSGGAEYDLFYQDGGFTSVATGTAAPVIGDTMRIEISGNNARVLVNGVEDIGWTDISAGPPSTGDRVGFCGRASNTADDFEAGAL
ncbi:MAG: hypothetical protein AAFV69_14025 [Pseudomonadota bacterium]